MKSDEGHQRRLRTQDQGAAGLPEFVEKWTREKFYGFGAAATVGVAGLGAAHGLCLETLLATGLISGYWLVGMRDMAQTHHAIRRNFPVLGNIRYLLESIRPEIHQYFIEGEHDSVPFSRAARVVAYKRAKGVGDNLPLGTRRDVYKPGYEWVNHSLYPTHITPDKARVVIGGPRCQQPYSASLLNISAMSYGALSDNAILALNGAAARGGFYHNTGEGGISRFHLEPGGDIVWNVGTGYFGCRNEDGTFSADMFAANARRPQIKMIELKLSQGAKPAHGGILPAAKITDAIREARGLAPDHNTDVLSPPRHSAFSNPDEMVAFIGRLRELSGGKPVGFKLCVGRPEELAAVLRACVKAGAGAGPDFITVDGKEGGTGAAPPEFSNSVGTPLVEGLALVDALLRGAGLREHTKVICSGKVLSGFSIVRNIALGADVCNSARAMMFALGCIQALKCDTNKCPTGIATQDKELMKGLVVPDKVTRVYRFHKKTVEAALEIVGATGVNNPSELTPSDINVRAEIYKVQTYGERFPRPERGSLLTGTAPAWVQTHWDRAAAMVPLPSDKRG